MSKRGGYISEITAVAHDSGNLINPLIVDGQIQGGVAHGIGNALLEWMGYDANAQPITTTFAIICCPARAMFRR
jgi:carbon-monoxide dehydrogenase large subunit